MKKKIRWPLYVIAALIVTFLAFVVPLPYYIEVPGGSEDIRQVLKVNDTEDKEAGAYQFVTVGVQHATLAHMIYAWLTPFTDIRSAQETTGGSSDVEFMRINQFYMQTSQNMAKYQGLKTAGKDIELKYFGVYVLNVTDNSTFKGILNISDTVTAVNDQTFDSSKDLIDYVSSQKLGDSVKVTYEEDGQTKSAEGKIITLENGKNGIGIGLIDRTEVISNVPISFSTAGIGGPSAGLMFSLAIYTQIAHPDLNQLSDAQELIQRQGIENWVSEMQTGYHNYITLLDNIQRERWVMLAGAVLGIATSILLFNTMNRLYFEEFRRAIFIKRIAGLRFLEIHRTYLFAQLGVFLLGFVASVFLQVEIGVAFLVLLLFTGLSLLQLHVQMQKENKMSMLVLKGG
ncbi:TPA: SepM family pheromone-processing serine protease [Streptococcus pneumoniae]